MLAEDALHNNLFSQCNKKKLFPVTEIVEQFDFLVSNTPVLGEKLQGFQFVGGRCI